MSRCFNFSAGPATLPENVLEQAASQLVDYKGTGFSIMEASHRGKEYDAVHNEALANIRELLSVPDDYEVLLMQGGATGQFALLPVNLLGEGQVADYLITGAWSKKAVAEAKAVGEVNIAFSTLDSDKISVPSQADLKLSDHAAYVHFTTNETIGGNQFKEYPITDAPLVADMSSDILSRPIDISKFAMIYAGAQKNMGSSGVAVVIIRKDFMEKGSEKIPGFFQYRNHAANNSMLNTPPCFSIYILSLTTRWLLDNGGVEEMEKINNRKSTVLYNAIDATDFYTAVAETNCRSTMNVTFRLPTEELEAQFIKEAVEIGMNGLKGHRSVGGIRASIYNAFPEAGVDALVAFMQEFEKENG